MNAEELKVVLDKHSGWLREEPAGVRANLRGANLSWANLSEADLRGADLSRADLSRADLRGANLSEATGLLSPIDWMAANLERADAGYICYKQLGNSYPPPVSWKCKPGAILTEVVNPLPTLDCACGVNVATRTWWGFEDDKPIWKCLIRWEWLPGVVIPYYPNGKFRAGRVELMEVVT